MRLFGKSEPDAIATLRRVVKQNEADRAAATAYAEKEAEIAADTEAASKAFLADPTPAKAQRYVEAERLRQDLPSWREVFRLASLAAEGKVAARTHEPIGAALAEMRNQLGQKIDSLRNEDARRAQELGIDAPGESPAVGALVNLKKKADDLHQRWQEGGLDPGTMQTAVTFCLG